MNNVREGNIRIHTHVSNANETNGLNIHKGGIGTRNQRNEQTQAS